MEALALCVDSLPDLWIQVPVVVTYLLIPAVLELNFSSMMARNGRAVKFSKRLKKSLLLIASNSPPPPSHCGIYCGIPQLFRGLHASPAGSTSLKSYSDFRTWVESSPTDVITVASQTRVTLKYAVKRIPRILRAQNGISEHILWAQASNTPPSI
ncbi:hypothetical protein B0H13DRAFT_767884 [Mycena leptocephala]|nr:hypothetical protein B0H13DRAFT_767884 [Mycena leptocephala]